MILACFEATVKRAKQNTFVVNLNKCLALGTQPEWILRQAQYSISRKPQTAQQLVAQLSYGSPCLWAIFNQILLQKVLESLDPVAFKGPRKLLIVDSIPLNAWFIENLMCILYSVRAQDPVCELIAEKMGTQRLAIRDLECPILSYRYI